MKLSTSAPYSRETLKRLAKVLEEYKVVPWFSPVTNAISIKSFNFIQHHPFSEGSVCQN